jgi:signal transduction histidine kinase/PAS domain-containing protein
MDAAIFFQLSPYAQCCLNRELILVKWNNAFEKLAGVQSPETTSLMKFILPVEQHQVRHLLASLTQGETKEASFSIVSLSGEYLLTHWKMYLGYDDIIYALQLQNQLSSHTVSRAETTEALAEIPTESLKSLIDHSSDMIARFDHQLRYTFVNQQFINQTQGISEEQLYGKTTLEIAPVLGVSTDTFTKWMQDLQQVLDTGKEVKHHDSIKLPTHTLHYQTQLFPEYTAGKVTGVLVITRIINELKYTEEKLKEQKNLLKMVFDCMQEGIMVVDTEQKFVLTNKQALMAIPIDPATKDYQEWAVQVESLYPDQQTILPADELPMQKALRGETVNAQLGYYKLKHEKQGIFLSVNASPLTNADDKLIGAVIVFNNVSDRIQAQEQIASSFATLKGIIENTHDLIVAIDKEYTILTVNTPARESFRISTGKTLDIADNLLQVLTDMPATAQELKACWSKALSGETYILMHETETTTTGIKYFESVYSPIYNEKRKVMGATMIGRDVTMKYRQDSEIKSLFKRLLLLNQQLEEKNNALLTGEEKLWSANEELQSQQEELKQTVDELASRNFELDQLVYKTSHDIRSPLTSILGLANVMKAERDTTQWPIYLSHIENRILTLDRFVQSMINYAKASRSKLEVQQIDFNKIVEQTKHELAYMKGFDSLAISLESTGVEVNFYGDLFRLQILFNNIISNAIKYQNPYAAQHYLRILVNLTPMQAEIIFTDNGIGIKEDHINRIFDMFYRATENTDGSGLGLYIVKQNVEKMKGKISLKSQYGIMTEFVVVLPNVGQSEQILE